MPKMPKPKSDLANPNPKNPAPPQPGYGQTQLGEGVSRNYPALEKVYVKDNMGQAYGVENNPYGFRNAVRRARDPKKIIEQYKQIYTPKQQKAWLPDALAKNTLAKIRDMKTPLSKEDAANPTKNALAILRAKKKGLK